jgi:hypothetical protein
MSRTNYRRILIIVAAVTMIGATGGYALAAGLTSTPVNQSAGLYSVSTSAVAAFPNTPTVTVTAIPASVGACTVGAQTLANSVIVNLYLPASTGITCATSDFAEEFSFTSLITAAAGTYEFTQYTTYGSSTSGSAVGTITIAATMSIVGTVNVFVDYGTAAPPASGIASLSLVVQ